MKLTKQLEVEVRQLYELYWNSYINGDLKTYASLLDNSFKFIGSTEAEPLLNKKDALKFLAATFEQLKGKAEFRNRKIKIEIKNDLVLINELCDGYILIGTDWTFYSRFRLSSLLQKKGKKWKFIHQHVSMPDSKAQEGESYGLELIRTENMQLREAVKRRTVELESKNHELEIEAALERVRARAMAMQTSDELKELIGTVFTELTKLDLVLTRCVIMIYDGQKNNSRWWMANSEDPNNPAGFFIKQHDHPPMVAYFKAWRERKIKYSYALQGKIKQDWDDFLFSETELKNLPGFVIEGMRAPDLVYLNASFNNFGNLTLASLEPLSDEHFDILLRFAKVFDLTYTRFNDLKQAEAQARESQIQLALERVRARTMAMQHSEELAETATVLFEQFNNLGEVPERIAIGIINEVEHVFDIWATQHGGTQMNLLLKLSLDEPHVMKKMYQAWKEQSKFITIDLQGNELEEYFQFLKKSGASVQREIFGVRRIENVATFSKGVLMIITTEPRHAEVNKILERFAGVFDQTYTRFLDLQKAEAQAREARIEAALERVRSRAMAMHKTDELLDAAELVSNELSALGIESMNVSYAFIDEDEKYASYYAGKILPFPFAFPHTETEVMRSILTSWKKQEPFNVIELDEKATLKHQTWAGGHIQNQITQNNLDFPFSVEAFLAASPKKAVIYSFNFSKGYLFKIGGVRLTKEQEEMLVRFTKVFDLTYRRFLDLKQAEAQAREAQIELALEKVRARTMGMQKSDELAEVVGLLFKQFEQLDFGLYQLLISIYDTRSNIIEWWSKGFGDIELPQRNIIPIIDHPFCNKLLETWKSGTEYYAHTLEGELKKTWEDYLFTQTDLKYFPQEVKDVMRSLDKVYLSDVFIKYGSIQAAGPMPLPDDKASILKRFAKVLDLAYTRMTDLQNAEAQAREAKIEAALEKVRSRSLAMHKSDELRAVVKVVFEKLKELDFAIDGGVFIATPVAGSYDTDIWIGDDHAEYPSCFKTPYWDSPIITDIWTARKSGNDFFSTTYSFEEKNRWFRFAFEKTDYKFLPDQFKTWILEQEFLTQSFALGNYSMIGIHFHHQKTLSENEIDILKRFSKVFEQGYVRFLDLQKAEALAKEAQVETALERVRARAMAMHTSQELKDVALELRNQMGTMAQPELEVCAIHLYEESPDHFDAWAAIRPPGDEGKIIPLQARFPKRGVKIVDEMMKAYHDGKKDYVLVNEGEKLLEWLDQLKEQVPEGFKMVLESFHGIDSQDSRTYWSLADFQGGALVMTTYIPPNDEARKLLRRFSNVFGLAYRRFVDLKQAEGQAREAQIELALERIRARTMAMHKSEELAETAQVLFQQLNELGGIPDRISIGIADEAKGVVNFWTTDQQGSHLDHSFSARLNERTTIAKTYKAWKKQKKSLVIDLHGEDLNEWIQFAREEMGIAVKGDQIKDRRVHSLAFFSHGWILVTSHEPQSIKTIQILERFASVFNLTYRRFLDLEKAEAQAKESELELALERVRAKSMAMRHSDELADLVKIVFKELTRIGFSVNACIIMTYDERTNDSTWWISNFDGVSNPFGLFVPNHSNKPYLAYLNEWKKQTTKWRYKLGGAEKKKWDQYLFNNSGLATLPDMVKTAMQSAEETYLNVCFNKYASITFGSFEPMSDKDFDTLHRFAKVFEQSYTRFLDLQKAEAQAREAHIETALERVRARTMGMHQSKELHDVIETVTNQLLALGLKFDNSVFCRINQDESWEMWMSTPQQSYPAVIYVPYLDHRIFHNLKEVKAKNLEFYTDVFEEDEARVFFKHFFENTIAKHVPEERKQYVLSRSGMARSLFLTKDIWFVISRYSPDPFNDDENSILKRFAKVFEQAYIRFRDLEKAEAQANEARVEIALERIRARALAMHKSDELMEVAKVMREQMALLGQADLEASAVHLYEEDPDNVLSWRAVTIGSDANREITYGHMAIPKNSCEFVQEWLTKFYSDLKEYTIELSGSKQEEWYEVLFKLAPEVINSMRQKHSMDEKRYYRFSKFSGGALLMIAKQEPSTEASYLQERAAVVFDLAYRRFSDLQKAEAQARESQIEAALERVRAKAMAMHSSKDLAETIGVFYRELKLLSVIPIRCGVALIDKETRMAEVTTMNTTEQGDSIQVIGNIKMAGHPVLEGVYENWLIQKEYHAVLRGNQIKEYYKVLKPQISYPDYSHDEVQFGYYFMFKEGDVYAWTETALTEDELAIYRRFTSVISLTYKRYNDLKQAEAQARESKIEASLERVRSKTMAMHNSQDVGETVATMFDELVKLGVETVRCGIAIIDESKTMEVWTASSKEDGSVKLIIGQLDMRTHPLFMQVYDAWKQKKSVTTYELVGEDLKDYFRNINNSPDYPIRYDIESLPYKQSNTAFIFPEGSLFVFSQEPLVTETIQIFKRFAGVFGQTYRRYLDLQKAEANAREAQIEAGLERVRARTMAMHSSEDVSMATATMFTELEKLGIENLRGGITIIKPDQTQEVWSITNLPDGRTIRAIGVFDMRLHPLWRALFKARENKADYNYYWLAGKDKEDYVKILNATPNYLAQPIKEIPDVHVQSYFFGEGGVWTNSLQPHSEEDKQIMKRFTSVFSLTFRRYQDLKKAEAQAREATIEAALEKVRGKAMAMHSSKDLATTIAVFYHELEGLNLTPRRCGVGLINKEAWTAEISTMNATADGQTIELIGVLDMRSHPVLTNVYKNWLTKTEYHPVLRGNEIKEYYQVIRPQFEFPDYPHDLVQYGYFFFFDEGGVHAWTEKELTEEELKIYRRFTSVLSLTYKRYKDLKDAEAQAREATIEAALEKVRGKAMAMHSSGDLSATASMVITELRKLGIKPIRCGVGILNKDTNKAQLYTATSTSNGDSLSVVGWVLLEGHPVLEQIYERWSNGEDYFPELIGDSMRKYYEQLLAGLSVPLPEFKDDGKHYGHFLAISVGCLYAWADVKYNDDEIKILKRFATTIDLTFRRYFELQKSEANAKEAVKQAALDRIRADIASMRTINDLDRITPLIWNELTVLGIPFIRCGVFIMDEEQQLIHTFLSTPDGKAIAAFHLPYETPGNISKVIDSWRHKKIYVDHWGEEEFIQFSEILMRQGALASREQYLKTIPHGGFHLHFLPFLQGMLYVGNTEQLNQEQIELIQHVADAFSTAYARYEDFNKLEAAKQQVENTLTDLKQTQQQLVQSEKMASLGELTAGIAHEIQNPLNFVNNFSDVSNELLEEMKNELEKGNKEDAIAIVEDIKQNLEKILHHGKRADAIVKGMLQHSRMSSGQKEPTDINMLADEYLRLAFHGLRAKDKSFNAKFETEFDNSIGKINIIPQDIGRVVLNLINNAFYAVTEKKKHALGGSASNGYEPTVTVSTKKQNGKIEIKVKDNGSGIPQKMLEKIFQPFFTTKPTGQGTGLGLSLAYDIVTKGHGGELKVETKEGEGTEFIIQLSAT